MEVTLQEGLPDCVECALKKEVGYLLESICPGWLCSLTSSRLSGAEWAGTTPFVGRGALGAGCIINPALRGSPGAVREG